MQFSPVPREDRVLRKRLRNTPINLDDLRERVLDESGEARMRRRQERQSDPVEEELYMRLHFFVQREMLQGNAGLLEAKKELLKDFRERLFVCLCRAYDQSPIEVDLQDFVDRGMQMMESLSTRTQVESFLTALPSDVFDRIKDERSKQEKNPPPQKKSSASVSGRQMPRAPGKSQMPLPNVSRQEGIEYRVGDPEEVVRSIRRDAESMLRDYRRRLLRTK